MTEHERRASRNALGSVADDSYVGNLPPTSWISGQDVGKEQLQAKEPCSKETKGGISPMVGKRPLKISANGSSWCEKFTWDPRVTGQLLGGALQWDL